MPQELQGYGLSSTWPDALSATRQWYRRGCLDHLRHNFAFADTGRVRSRTEASSEQHKRQSRPQTLGLHGQASSDAHHRRPNIFPADTPAHDDQARAPSPAQREVEHESMAGVAASPEVKARVRSLAVPRS